MMWRLVDVVSMAAPKTRPTRKTVPVECWSGIEQIDADIAPLVEAWNATGWLVAQESCSGHGETPAYVTVNIRLDHLAGSSASSAASTPSSVPTTCTGCGRSFS